MRVRESLAVLGGTMLVLGLVASVAYADTVTCAPIPSTASICPGFIFTVCNTPESRCTEAGCICDLHLKVIRSDFRFTKGIKLPTGWQGAASKDGTTFAASATDPRYCLGINSKCLPFQIGLPVSAPPQGGRVCVTIQWWTTDVWGETIDSGTTKCCVEIPG